MYLLDHKDLRSDVPDSVPLSRLEGLEDRVLLYPVCGGDFLVPVLHFAPVIDVFWMVDRGYFRPGHQDTRFFGLDQPADTVSPILKDPALDFQGATLEGPPAIDSRGVHITPCVLTEQYIHLPTGRSIQVKFRRGYGHSTFDKEISRLSIFFYRGDSQGEGGSGNNWYGRDPGKRIWDKLVDGGWLVTDLSNSYSQDAFLEIAIEQNLGTLQKASELLDPMYQFYSESIDRTFKCIGTLSDRYRPCLIFQITKGDTREEGAPKRPLLSKREWKKILKAKLFPKEE